MSKRGPSQDGSEATQMALDVERAAELRDDPELPPEQRIERAVARFERRVSQWEATTAGADVAERANEVELWLSHIQHTVESSGRAADPFAFAVHRLETAPGAARAKKVNQLRNKGWPEEKRHQAYDRAEVDAVRKVLDHNGAALWWEQTGNRERLHAILETLSGTAARAA